MEAGITVSDWFAREAERVYTRLHFSESAREDDALIEYIRRQGGSIKPSYLQRSGARKFRGTADEVRQRLEALVAAGIGSWVHRKSGATGGRPSVLFSLSGTETKPHSEGSERGFSIQDDPNRGGFVSSESEENDK